MKLAPIENTPEQTSYDVVIVVGAMLGSSVAWYLSDNNDFNGRVLVVEKDPSYEWCSTAHTNSCMRQQFSNGYCQRYCQVSQTLGSQPPPRRG